MITEETKLIELDIDARYLNPFAEHDIHTIKQVLDTADGKRKNLLKLKGIGHRTVEVVLETIEQADFDVPEEVEEPERTPQDDELADQVIDLIETDYIFFRGGWQKWDGGIWTEVKSIYRFIKKVLRENRYRGVKISKARHGSVEFFCEQELTIEDESVVDDYPQYFNVENGIFNLDTMQLENHRKDVYCTAQAGFEYQPNVDCPTFRQWLADMLVHDGTTNTDFSMVNLVQEMMGYCLTADTSHRVSFWIIGASGTGKSTLVNIMVKMMKSYHKTIDLNQLATNRFLLATIAGKRLITSVEASAGVRLEDGIYKTLVSDDVVLADVKNRDPIEFIPQGKIVWAMNNLPYVGDRSGAVDSRVKIVPMTRQIPRDQWDLRLDEKLLAELPGIFNFALQGLQRLRSQGHFTRVEQSEKMSEEYRKMQDIYSAFLDDTEWCIRGDDKSAQATQLYKTFSSWARENGINHHASKISIAREWKRLGLLKKKQSDANYYHGVGLVLRDSSQY